MHGAFVRRRESLLDLLEHESLLVLVLVRRAEGQTTEHHREENDASETDEETLRDDCTTCTACAVCTRIVQLV